MEQQIDLSTNSAVLNKAYQSVLSSDAITNWVLFTYGSGQNANVLQLHSSGSGGLAEITEDCFETSKIMYAFVRVVDDGVDGSGKQSGGGSGMEKFVLITWVGDGVPVLRKALISTHVQSVRNLLKGYHVEISARTEADLSPRLIMKKVRDSSGAKYSHQQQDLTHVRKDIADSGPSHDVGSNYKRPEIVKSTQSQKIGTEPDYGSQSEAQRVRQEREQRERELVERERVAQRERESEQQKQRDERDKHEREQKERDRQARERQDKEAHAERQRQQQEREAASTTSKLESETAARVPDIVAQQANKTKNIWAQREKEAAQVQAATNANVNRSNTNMANTKKWGSQQKLGDGGSSRPGSQVNLHGGSSRPVSHVDLHNASSHAAHAPAAVNRSLHTGGSNTGVNKSMSGSNTNVSKTVPAVNKSLGGGMNKSRTDIDQASKAKAQEDARMFELAKQELRRKSEQQHAEQARMVAQAAQEQQEAEQRELKAKQEADRAAEEHARQQMEAVHLEQEGNSKQKSPQPQQSGKSVVAVYDYEAAEANELSFKEGDVIHDIVELDVGWWQGTLNGKQGILPANYVKYQNAAEPAAATITQSPTASGFTVKALYDYAAGEENEISFHEGEQIAQVQQVTDDWWSGECHGKVGLFPANYVQRV